MKQSSCLRVVDGLLDIKQMIYKRKYVTLDLIKNLTKIWKEHYGRCRNRQDKEQSGCIGVLFSLDGDEEGNTFSYWTTFPPRLLQRGSVTKGTCH